MRNLKKVSLIMFFVFSMLLTQVSAFSNEGNSKTKGKNEFGNELEEKVKLGRDMELDSKSFKELKGSGRSKYKTKIDNKNFDTIVFTSQEDLQALIEIHNAKIPEGYCIEKIELFLENNVNDAGNNYSGIQLNHWDWLYRSITSTNDRGTGWYFPGNPYRDDWWDGPDTAKISETNSHSATVSSTLGVSDSSISAEVGFSITSSYSVTLTSETPVPANKRLNVKTYVTYKRVDFDVWEYHLFNEPHYYDTGSAYKPLGSYFAKFWYTK